MPLNHLDMVVSKSQTSTLFSQTSFTFISVRIGAATALNVSWQGSSKKTPATG